MENQDVRKAQDGVSNWIMKECNNQLAGKLHSLIESSIKESRVPLDWKRANINHWQFFLLIFEGLVFFRFTNDQ